MEIDTSRKFWVISVVIGYEEHFRLGGFLGHFNDLLLLLVWFLAEDIHKSLLLRWRCYDRLSPVHSLRSFDEYKVIMDFWVGHTGGRAISGF